MGRNVDKEDINEREVEKHIIDNIKKFIMEFGKDFAFVGNQYHLEIYSEEFFPNLLFVGEGDIRNQEYSRT